MKLCPKCSEKYDDTQGFCPRDGSVLAEDHSALIGRVLDGQYEIEAFIAAGGMGAVYRARHILLGDRVAIKVLPAGMQRNGDWLKRFQREGQAARRFRHPNAVVVHDLRTSEDGLIYLVMEYVAGTTLDHLVRQNGGRLSPAATVPIIEAVASALDAAHKQGVVHRDLKPGNIMITDDGTVKLLDLGIAKICDPEPDQAGLTTEGQFLGTPYFMSPEQWGEIPLDGGHEIDGRADIYSLGVVVYQLTAGALPFNGKTTLEVRRAHMKETPRSLESWGASVPANWSSAVMRALSKDRSGRQATAGEFARELSAALDDVTDTPGSTAPTLINTGIQDHVETKKQNQPTTPDATPTAEAIAAPAVGVTGDAMPKRSWTMSLLHNRGCQVSITVAAMLVVGVMVGIPLLLNSLRNGSDSTRSANSNKPSSNKNANTGTPSGQPLLVYNVLVRSAPFDDPKRTVATDTFFTGQIVQFLVKANFDGYLYLFNGEMSHRPVAVPLDFTHGYTYVKVSRGQEITLPDLPVVKLEDYLGDETFTLVIAPTELSFPSTVDSLPTDGGLRKLNDAEIRLLKDLIERSRTLESKVDGERTAVYSESDKPSEPLVLNVKLRVDLR
ncbi:MAG: serine/threonine-protein kinase [Pyrinomonadaceae bacterium]